MPGEVPAMSRKYFQVSRLEATGVLIKPTFIRFVNVLKNVLHLKYKSHKDIQQQLIHQHLLSVHRMVCAVLIQNNGNAFSALNENCGSLKVIH